MPGEANGTAQSWDQLPNAMSQSVKTLQKSLDNDKQWQAFINTNAIVEQVTMGVASAGGDAILVTVDAGSKTKVSTGSPDKADFTLAAKGDQWQKFFDADPKAPFTSFVGLQVSTSSRNLVMLHHLILNSRGPLYLGNEHQTRRSRNPRQPNALRSIRPPRHAPP